MYKREALSQLLHIPTPWLFLSSNKSSFQDRGKLGTSALAMHGTHTLAYPRGLKREEKCSAWQVIQHQELDPLKNNIGGLMFPQAEECLPCKLPISPAFPAPRESLLFSGSFVSSETQLGEQCVNGSIYHLVWLASSLGMGARGQGKELMLRLWGSVWDLGKCIYWEPCECPNMGKWFHTAIQWTVMTFTGNDVQEEFLMK